jgi:hypothetical protein
VSAVVAVGGDFKYFSRRSYATEGQAKLAAFDLVTKLLNGSQERK